MSDSSAVAPSAAAAAPAPSAQGGSSWFGGLFGRRSQSSSPSSTSSSSASPEGSKAAPVETIASMIGDVAPLARPVFPGAPSLSASPAAAGADSKNADAVEYLFIDEQPLFPGQQAPPKPTGSWGPLPMRTGYDKLLYGTGTAYLLGLSTAGAYGAARGWYLTRRQKRLIMINSVLNQSARYGPWAANSLGVMCLAWALTDNALEAYRETSDYYNHVAAAFTSGVLFKCTAGPRAAVLTGTLLSGAVLAYGAAAHYVGEWSDARAAKKDAPAAPAALAA
ncbi:hypothetical protein CXG81DRAFT_17682 [Caulochytrium protostelioides]|uniref:Tim17-domain-containing protein n=1 Tax=Caulochytrium protostelioides TaxID=1555241 RepID=A0A4P9XBC0_9FUNG|nr:hypothetical protein CXG81DRAFT_17682 [Caulochytrium protostelioides]|eukprot:RKP02714.1 hypothetical protein CXG81DRAFT_17682 [Caulochytrium protostelioides]